MRVYLDTMAGDFIRPPIGGPPRCRPPATSASPGPVGTCARRSSRPPRRAASPASGRHRPTSTDGLSGSANCPARRETTAPGASPRLRSQRSSTPISSGWSRSRRSLVAGSSALPLRHEPRGSPLHQLCGMTRDLSKTCAETGQIRNLTERSHFGRCVRRVRRRPPGRPRQRQPGGVGWRWPGSPGRSGR